MNIIAIANQKGGVGKTTTAVNLSACLARSGRSTLLVDLDPQCNATEHVKAKSPDDETISSYALIADKEPDLEQIIAPIGPNWQLAPGHIALAEIDMNMSSALNREARLRRALTRLNPKPEYVVIDCAPSLSISTMNALCAATHLIIAVQTNSFSYKALKRLMTIVEDVVDQSNPDLKVFALATMHRAGVNINEDILARIREDFEGLAFDSTIRYTTAFVEASEAGRPIIDYANGSKGHQDFESLTKELIERVERKQSQKAKVR